MALRQKSLIIEQVFESVNGLTEILSLKIRMLSLFSLSIVLIIIAAANLCEIASFDWSAIYWGVSSCITLVGAFVVINPNAELWMSHDVTKKKTWPEKNSLESGPVFKLIISRSSQPGFLGLTYWYKPTSRDYLCSNIPLKAPAIGYINPSSKPDWMAPMPPAMTTAIVARPEWLIFGES